MDEPSLSGCPTDESSPPPPVGDDGECSNPSPAETEPRQHSPSRGIDPSRVTRQLERRAESVKRDELEEALSELDRRGGLTAQQRRVVSELAATLAHAVVAEPKLAARDPRCEPETVRTIAWLFDIDDG